VHGDRLQLGPQLFVLLAGERSPQALLKEMLKVADAAAFAKPDFRFDVGEEAVALAIAQQRIHVDAAFVALGLGGVGGVGTGTQLVQGFGDAVEGVVVDAFNFPAEAPFQTVEDLLQGNISRSFANTAEGAGDAAGSGANGLDGVFQGHAHVVVKVDGEGGVVGMGQEVGDPAVGGFGSEEADGVAEEKMLNIGLELADAVHQETKIGAGGVLGGKANF